MKFKDFEYKRVNIKNLKKCFIKHLEDFETVKSFEEQDRLMKRINELRTDFESMKHIAETRFAIDTRDEFYENENDYYDEVSPIYEGLVSDYYRRLTGSIFRDKLETKWGKQLFRLAELKIKTFSEEVIEDLQKENKLCSSYEKLQASASIMFEGKERTLEQMVPFTMSKERDLRIKAQEALTDFYLENEDEFDSIYHDLVQLRDKIAKVLGFKNFVELAYARLNRTDYNAEDVSNYRKQVLEEIVPLTSDLRKRQIKRLKLDSLKYYDEPLNFLSGNASPKGSSEWIIDNGRIMYKELSPETDKFFSFMTENELMDLESQKGKLGGCYCEYFAKYKSPFIFSNFNGTSDDINVLTHEAGHAFQVYSSNEHTLPEYSWPTYEACEIHSMSMEYFTWPWMEKFFKDDEIKYKFSHLSEALLFIPYGVTVDEFQHWVYENPTATPRERKTAWRDIEQKYLPSRDYENNEFLENGGFWFKQIHIFCDPFYFIDYTLAQVSAFEFWSKSSKDKEKTWLDYLKLCKAGGSKSFLELLELANLNNPFADGTLKKTISTVSGWLETIDDTKL